jgi:hypothetical protein
MPEAKIVLKIRLANDVTGVPALSSGFTISFSLTKERQLSNFKVLDSAKE